MAAIEPPNVLSILLYNAAVLQVTNVIAFDALAIAAVEPWEISGLHIAGISELDQPSTPD